jgi:penicillin amidase
VWWRGERDAIIRTAFRDAVEEIRAVLGNNLDRWRLDAMHRVKLEHELGKAAPPLAGFFNLDPAPWGGGPATLGRARYRYDRAYDATGGATVRVVGEMGDAPDMRAVIPGGQSGHPLSPHYGDQFHHWLAGNLLPISPALPSAGMKTETLVPAS